MCFEYVIINLMGGQRQAKYGMSKIACHIIGIKHDFPFINIPKVPREVLKTEGKTNHV